MILQFRVNSPVQAHDVLASLWASTIKPHVVHGAAGVITWHTENAYLRKKMRGKLHTLLRFIAEAVWFTDAKTGLRYRHSMLCWKEMFKQELLEPVIEERKNRRTGEITFKARRLSTEELPDDEFAEFLTAVEAFAIVDLGLDLPDEQY